MDVAVAAPSFEGHFDISEIFFSRTDGHGIIQSGNTVFKSVSGHGWAGLLHSPHNIIRHHDMPKGVFHLLWETIKQGKPLGAYVKNKTKSGQPYWVFAVVMPIKDGYLSVRIKPTSPLFSVVQVEYENFRKKEVLEKVTPLKGHENIVARMKELGFSNYAKFMVQALLTEWSAREVALERDDELVNLLKKVQDIGASLSKESFILLDTMKASRYLPLNLEIGSARIGREGDSISAVALQYEKAVEEVKLEVASFEKNMSTLHEKLEESQFYVCASKLMDEVVAEFEKQKDESPVDRKLEMSYLTQKASEDKTLARTGLEEVIAALDLFLNSCLQIRSLLLRLEIVRITGKIESARLGAEGAIFNNLMGQLKAFQGTLFSAVDKMDQSAQALKTDANQIMTKSF